MVAGIGRRLVKTRKESGGAVQVARVLGQDLDGLVPRSFPQHRNQEGQEDVDAIGFVEILDDRHPPLHGRKNEGKETRHAVDW